MFKERRFECVLIACDTQNDFEYMSPKLVAYQKCPVVTIVGNGLSLPTEFKHAKVFKKGEEARARQHMIQEIAKIKVHIS
jgi:hypothetical protein